MSLLKYCFAAFAFAFVLLATTAVAGEIQILPSTFTLHGSEGRQQLSVVKMRGKQLSASVPADEVTLESSDPSIVKMSREWPSRWQTATPRLLPVRQATIHRKCKSHCGWRRSAARLELSQRCASGYSHVGWLQHRRLSRCAGRQGWLSAQPARLR